jgi:hypothetical protein
MTESTLVAHFELSQRACPPKYNAVLQAVIPSEDPKADEVLVYVQSSSSKL